MVDYRVYCLDGAGKISFADNVEAPDDEQAIATARLMKVNGIKCEIWQGQRLVAELSAQDLSG